MMKLARMTALAASIILALTGGVSAQQVTFRLGHVDAQASHSGVGADAFAAAVARLSNGEMKVNVFHAGQLGSWTVVELHEPAKVWHDYLVYPVFVYFLGTQLPFLWQVRWRTHRWAQPALAALVVLTFAGWVVLGHVYDPAHRVDQRPLLYFADGPSSFADGPLSFADGP